MKIRNIISIIFISATLIASLFATPAVHIQAFDRDIHWDGLNLKTVTGDKYEGELQFKNGLDLRGGTEYVFNLDLTSTENNKKEEYTKKIVDKFAERLELYGYKDFQIGWSMKDANTAEIDLKTAKKTESDSTVIQLLASRGSFQFWTQDPTYTEDSQDQQTFSFLTGMTPADVSQDDIYKMTSLFSNKANGYGFKIDFKTESITNLALMSQKETSRGTMLVIDGQPIGFRTYPIENLTSTSKNAKPVMYMASLFSTSFDVNDTVPAIFNSGEMDQELTLTEQNEIGPSVSEKSEWDLKFLFVVSLLLISLILIYRYRYIGVYQVLVIGEFLVWTLFLLKLMSAYLNLSLILGVVSALILTILLENTITRKLKAEYEKNEKHYQPTIKEVRPVYRNLILALMAISIVMSYSPFIEISGFGNGLGAGTVVVLVLLYLLDPSLLQFLVWQKEYEKIEKI